MNLFMDILAVISGFVGIIGVREEINNPYSGITARVTGAIAYGIVVIFAILSLIYN